MYNLYLVKRIIFFFTFFFLLITVFSCNSNKKEGIIVLYTKKDVVTPELIENCCEYIPMEGFKNTHRRSKTVIYSGHGMPPLFGTYPVKEVAEAISSFKPEIIILNSCYGATNVLLEELEKNNKGALVVAPAFPIYAPGFIYEQDFFNENLSNEERIKAIKTEPYYPVLKWKINREDLEKVNKKFDSMTSKELKNNLRRLSPTLVRVKLSTKLEPNADVLVLTDIKKLK